MHAAATEATGTRFRAPRLRIAPQQGRTLAIAIMEPRHPLTGARLTELERQLWRLRMAAHEATEVLRGLNQYPDAAATINDALWFTITNQCLLIVSKFLEVWDDFGALAKVDDRIVEVRRSAQPLLDRMAVWPGLRDFRNTAGAHAYTDKTGALVPPWILLTGNKAPVFHAEIILLLKLVPISVSVALSAFHEEFTGIETLCGPGGVPLPDAAPGIRHGSDIDLALVPIVSDVVRRFTIAFGRPISPGIVDMFRRASQPRDG